MISKSNQINRCSCITAGKMNRMRSQFFSDRTRNECQELSKQLDKLIDLVKEQKETSFNMQQQVESLTVLVEETSNDLKSLGEEVGVLVQK